MNPLVAAVVETVAVFGALLVIVGASVLVGWRVHQIVRDQEGESE